MYIYIYFFLFQNILNNNNHVQIRRNRYNFDKKKILLRKEEQKKNPDAIIKSIKFLKKSFKQKSTQESKFLKVATTIESDDDDDDEKHTTPPPVAHEQKSDEVFVSTNVEKNKVQHSRVDVTHIFY